MRALLLCTILMFVVGCDNKPPARPQSQVSTRHHSVLIRPEYQVLQDLLDYWPVIEQDPRYKALDDKGKKEVQSRYWGMLPPLQSDPSPLFFGPSPMEEYERRQFNADLNEINNNLGRILEEQKRHDQELESSISNFEWQQRHELWKERLRRGW